jgi:hypothetical protein
MRRALWVAVAIIAAALVWTVVPSVLVTLRVREAVRAQLQPTGPLAVRARTTLAGMLGGRARAIDIDATGARLGDVAAQRLRVRLRGVRIREGGDGRLTTDVEAGSAEVEVSGADLEQLLRSRGVSQPSVAITADGIAISGDVQVGPVLAKTQLRGQFYVVGTTDVHFRITALTMSGIDVPAAIATAALGLTTTPVVSLKGLPVAVVIDRVEMQAGKAMLYARAGGAVP